jgi:hypothetical protein
MPSTIRLKKKTDTAPANAPCQLNYQRDQDNTAPEQEPSIIEPHVVGGHAGPSVRAPDTKYQCETDHPTQHRATDAKRPAYSLNQLEYESTSARDPWRPVTADVTP